MVFTIKLPAPNSGNNENLPDLPSASQATTQHSDKPQDADVTAPTTKKRAFWSASDDSKLITHLEGCVSNGNVSDNGWKKCQR